MIGPIGSIPAVRLSAVHRSASIAPMKSLPEGSSRLDDIIEDRIHDIPTGDYEVVKFPVGLFFVRGDRAGPGKTLREQVVASFNYWDSSSGKYLDLLFPGWSKDHDGGIVFDPVEFLHVVSEVQCESKWTYSGETDLLLIDYFYYRSEKKGEFSFKESMTLPVEKMIHEKKLRSLDQLLHQLIEYAKETWPRDNEAALWKISDKVAVYKGSDLLWVKLKELIPFKLGEIFDEFKPYAICDLSKP